MAAAFFLLRSKPLQLSVCELRSVLMCHLDSVRTNLTPCLVGARSSASTPFYSAKQLLLGSLCVGSVTCQNMSRFNRTRCVKQQVQALKHGSRAVELIWDGQVRWYSQCGGFVLRWNCGHLHKMVCRDCVAHFGQCKELKTNRSRCQITKAWREVPLSLLCSTGFLQSGKRREITREGTRATSHERGLLCRLTLSWYDSCPLRFDLRLACVAHAKRTANTAHTPSRFCRTRR